ncbi:MAG TPA: hypothetical protein VFQ83_09360, partial [Candidatus Udaeobacter sp.]|nr:hypothetical protein [Candidatus Udaeobacter sp.]
FIEYDELQTKWSPENQTSRRALYWADWKRVSLLLRKLTDAGTDSLQLPSPAKLRDILLHQKKEKSTRKLLAFYATQLERNYTNVSRATDVMDFFFHRETRDRRARYLGAANDGYVARAGRMSPDQAATYERGLFVAMPEAGTRPLSCYSLEAYRQCAQEVRNSGATPIFLITPSTTQIDIALESNGAPGLLMAFNDPQTYPSLYRSDVRRDGQHLTKAGSEEFTRLVAAKFVELARGSGSK